MPEERLGHAAVPTHRLSENAILSHHATGEVARGGILREGLGYERNNVAVVLNVQPDHLGLRGIDTVEQLADVKAVIVEAVPRDGHAVLNADDPVVDAMAATTEARVVRVGRSSGADVWAGDVGLDDLARARFTLHAGGAQTDVVLAVHGDHQVSNALAAAAVALALLTNPPMTLTARNPKCPA